MIEKFSDNQLQIILGELKQAGYITGIHQLEIEEKNRSRVNLLLEQMNALEMYNPYIGEDLMKAIFDITDELLQNYDRSKKGKIRRKIVPKNNIPDYKKMLNGILTAMKPFYNKTAGFRDKNWRNFEEE